MLLISKQDYHSSKNGLTAAILLTSGFQVSSLPKVSLQEFFKIMQENTLSLLMK